jgi:predicted membrane metal-binding protein
VLSCSEQPGSAGLAILLAVGLMPYTDKPLALVWLIAFGFVALSGSAMVVSSWVLLLLVAVPVIPALVVTFYAKLRSTVAAITTQREPARVLLTVRSQSSVETSSIDVYRWEDEGGART